MEDPNIVLDRAKVSLFSMPNTTFIRHVLFGLNERWSEQIPTLATNGIDLLINKDFYCSLEDTYRPSALCHEAWHPILLHTDPDRRGDRDPRLWNMAGDFQIHCIFKENGIPVHPHWLYDSKYHDWSTEEIYQDLLQQDDSGSMPGEGTKGLGEDLQEAPDAAPAGSPSIKDHIERTIIQAYVAAKKEGDKTIGNLPGHLQRFIDESLNPKVDWKTLFQKYFTSKAKDDYTYKRPNRRYLPQFYLPSLYSESMGEVAFICDASGSVMEEQFNEFFNEGRSIKSTLQPEKFTIMSFDTELYKPHEYGKYEEMGKPVLEGGGGTCIRPVIQWLNKNNPEIAVIFTDGEFYFDDDMKYPGELLWLIYENSDFKPPFGEVIHYN
jgi:predicted metal-dependent peptidase